MGRTLKLILILAILIGASAFVFRNQLIFKKEPGQSVSKTEKKEAPDPLSIAAMRQKDYPGSEITIEKTLLPGTNYQKYLASYKSDGLKIYALLTVPSGEPPAGGWPAIIFNHGYIPPDVYQTAERYVSYMDAFTRDGYIVFKPDYRGNGDSEGEPEGAYYSPGYATDVLNAVSSIKIYKGVNPQKIGMWGHSMGGNITLRALVVSKDIKAAVIWGGVVGTYEELMTKWHRSRPWSPSTREAESHVRSIRQHLVEKKGTPESNPEFWHSIDPRYYLSEISSPIQLHHGLADEEVPSEFSESLKNDLDKLGKAVEYYTYPGADHNISGASFNSAMSRSVDFFNKYLK